MDEDDHPLADAHVELLRDLFAQEKIARLLKPAPGRDARRERRHLRFAERVDPADLDPRRVVGRLQHPVNRQARRVPLDARGSERCPRSGYLVGRQTVLRRRVFFVQGRADLQAALIDRDLCVGHRGHEAVRHTPQEDDDETCERDHRDHQDRPTRVPPEPSPGHA